ncbi:hypothetical protein ILUMI_02387 [Ignelater luminosus]|uniref:Protein YIPF3 n=1 Tax=Ignelater luminosus TaxID=2038154 RepID=A0A8K0GLE2_IGNLU|nr:hypothetical protein ILUMI_02387 [Ignelater luminosus]
MFLELYGVFAKVFTKFNEKWRVRKERLKQLFWVSFTDVFIRITVSIMPPLTAKYKKIFVDFVGPMYSILILIFLLDYGRTFKSFELGLSPVSVVLCYMIFMPIICFILNLIGRSSLTFLEIFALIGYALYGHILALLVSFLITQENNDAVFFVCLVVFGGLSTLRMVLLQLQLIPQPVARLLVCSLVSVIHILFLVFLHFTFMHPQFIYGNKNHI